MHTWLLWSYTLVSLTMTFTEGWHSHTHHPIRIRFYDENKCFWPRYTSRYVDMWYVDKMGVNHHYLHNVAKRLSTICCLKSRSLAIITLHPQSHNLSLKCKPSKLHQKVVGWSPMYQTFDFGSHCRRWRMDGYWRSSQSTAHLFRGLSIASDKSSVNLQGTDNTFPAHRKSTSTTDIVVQMTRVNLNTVDCVNLPVPRHGSP